MTIGFLHTSPLHVATFGALVDRLAPGEVTLHAVDEELLAVARTAGEESVRPHVEAAVRNLVSRGADVVVCTCSTIGPLVEEAATPGAAPVLRVDRPAAARAAELAGANGGAVGAVVAVESTRGPTRDLLLASTAQPVEVVLAPGAWEKFETGDVAAYLGAVEQAVRELAPRVAVVLLAQASMAAVATRVDDLPVPVLATPQVAVEAALAVRAAQAQGDAPTG